MRVDNNHSWDLYAADAKQVKCQQNGKRYRSQHFCRASLLQKHWKMKRWRFKIGLKQSLCLLYLSWVHECRTSTEPFATCHNNSSYRWCFAACCIKKNCPTLCWETDNNELLAAVEDVKYLLHDYCCLDVSLHFQSSEKTSTLETLCLCLPLRVALTWLFLGIRSGHNINNMIRCQLLCNRIGLTNDAYLGDCHWNSYDSTPSIVVWCLEM